MTIFGVSIILILGIINFFLLIFQLVSGLHKIKVPLKVHKTTGIIFFVVAIFHGTLGILALAL